MKQHTLTVPKTARYFTLGESGTQVREVWFVCHGYAQLATDFLENFRVLETPERLLVAPEALHRFYAKGASDRVAASWMTREDRLNDIRDYVAWLDLAASDVLRQLPADVRIVVLGFSQGAATVSRWLAQSPLKAHELVLWCGFFPPDMEQQKLPSGTQLTVVTATNDRFITPEENQRQLDLLAEQNYTFRHILFNGEHSIEEDHLNKLVRLLKQ